MCSKVRGQHLGRRSSYMKIHLYIEVGDISGRCIPSSEKPGFPVLVLGELRQNGRPLPGRTRMKHSGFIKHYPRKQDLNPLSQGWLWDGHEIPLPRIKVKQ